MLLNKPKVVLPHQKETGSVCASPTVIFVWLHSVVPNCGKTKAFVGQVLLTTVISYLPYPSLIEINDTIFFLKKKNLCLMKSLSCHNLSSRDK